MKTLLIFAVVLFFLYLFYKAYRKLNIYKDLDKILEQNPVILDVRTKPEFEGLHIKGAKNIPLGKLRTEYVQLDMNQPIITYCSHGLRSVRAVNVLKARGYAKVYNGGGLEDMEKIVLSKKH